MSDVGCRPFDFAQGKIAYRGGWVIGRGGDFRGGEIGFVWV